jgi:peptidoglycan hydrolase CwlO-like protein
MRKLCFVLALLATPALADELSKPDARVAELESQVRGLREQVQRADAIIGALSRQRNEAMDRAVLMETRAPAAEALAAQKPEDPKK